MQVPRASRGSSLRLPMHVLSMKPSTTVLTMVATAALAWIALACAHPTGTASAGTHRRIVMPSTACYKKDGVGTALLHEGDCRLTESTRNGCSVALSIRGGDSDAIAVPDADGDNDVSLIVSKVRNVVRNLMRFGDKKMPIVSKVLRPCFSLIESVTGIRILPVRTKSKPLPLKKKKKKRDSTKKQSSAEAKSSTGTKPSIPNKKKKKKSSERTNIAASTTATTKKHLTSKLKTGSGVYRIQQELKQFMEDPPDNLSVSVGSNIRVWIVTMKGAKGSIYEGEVFKLRIKFPDQYPTVPPSVYFLQGHMPIHEHVYTNGDICLSLLGKGWSPPATAQSIANSILSMLSSARSKKLPMDNAQHALNKPGKYQKDWVYHDDNC